ncbi:2-amino-4-hydroxy-6-hydroxymethyldihydropteridine diphosphokinase [Oceanihabitans sediminis]|uniref:2-amino-4-hydroxy-6-hydroxymethyldihydropteridine pyrophosphokinase n=1 Tax=Oceanihabitans sediminis TaxID=1812012 RepID=A0A368P542_9FLAO|nr:2-amino-4-hydroxy-6-hydroxymethyldihydropteridine diphosphokinase [Oceanihabitans sediminis]MDX1278377.1 2-amino-4-hydroxy-6-hydroxymethyldihydropteridine diphosphokinase [Oceanihabitans sediminis]MDX1772655.1 2-amino-4-hydroxy-6-hydroxymethyldihydropteridine diphosphokinase [Oceanihabitans sediminis]RBP34325.1 2-amino-4-hydroxy-6-hydroxymethyldihydropteridine diphosphokinase [Oceanihabitans sediminis]RCU58007.1 2-amino-4-hydroxy-6-hydroxymethyldihydropteridine diphosphokinase [Oceanihabitan
MNQSQKAYISIGSNQGDKFNNLQNAINAIYNEIGVIKSISKVYKTPAFGFEGEEFLNACLLIESELKPAKLLKKLLEIEKKLGRIRSKEKGYQSRIIDLDVIFIEDEIIETTSLIVPHPEMHKRRFVLQPLADIASNFIHPKLKKEVAVLLEECEDSSVLESINIWLKNPIKQYDFSKYNFIAIEGNIGAGKTSLSNKIARDFNAKLILERFADNPFLPKFYKEPKRYAFTLEMSFLADRYQQISDDLSQLDLFKDFIVSDYDVFKSLIFSKITLPEDEFKLYRKLFYQVYKDIAKPDLYVYLYQNTERLQENIKKRGRKYEKDIENDYLEKINTGYLDFLKEQTELNVKIIDISEKDFVKNREDYLWLLEKICE